MSITKALLASATLAAATAACAQDSSYETKTEVLDAQVTDSFALADSNADGGLDRAEYQVYVETEAAAGDADSLRIAEAGEYDIEFMTKDVNADGLLDASELVVIEEPDMDDSME